MTAYAFHPARIVEIRVDTVDIRTFTMELLDRDARRSFSFAPGQFNMLYAYGVGEVPISIVSDPQAPEHIAHTIRRAGRVTSVMMDWQIGDVVGVRGPYGIGWPMDGAKGRDVIIVTGGLGCAPVVGVIDEIFRHRDDYGELHIFHGVRTPRDLLYRERFDAWRHAPRTQVHLTADQPDKSWRYKIGVVTNLFDDVDVGPDAVVMMCGPEVMMRYGARSLHRKGIREDAIYVSLERHMQCAIGLCGHCQLGPLFVCKDGPVFRYAAVKHLLERSGI